MKNTLKLVIAGSALSLSIATSPVLAEGPMAHFGEALKNIGGATAHSTVGSAKLASGAVAVPFSVVGGIGKVSDRAAENLWEITTAPYDDSVVSLEESDSDQYE